MENISDKRLTLERGRQTSRLNIANKRLSIEQIFYFF